MNKIMLPLFVCLLLHTATAQIPNAGFENWANSSTLDGWATTNNILFTNVTQSTSSHSGTYAVRGDVAQVSTVTFSPTIQSGIDARGFTYTGRPVSITGYYQFFPAASSGDRFGVNVGLYKGGVDGLNVGIAPITISATTSTYTQFTANFIYQTSDIPDTCVIEFLIIGPGTGTEAYPHLGSYYLLDDLAFAGGTNVENSPVNKPDDFSLSQNYPNPFNPSTNISFDLSKGGYVTLRVFNILGKEVATLVKGYKDRGQHTAQFDATNLASGVYFYRLDVGNYSAMKQMVLIK